VKLLESIAEEATSGIVGEVRRYVAMVGILVIVLVLAFGVMLAARMLRAIDRESAQSQPASALAPPTSPPTASPVDEDRQAAEWASRDEGADTQFGRPDNDWGKPTD
jgi:hypothetical protein